MRSIGVILLIVATAVHAGCSRSGDKVYRGYLGPERASMSVVTLHLDPGVRSITLRERELERSEYATLILAPGEYTLSNGDGASIAFRIRRNLVDERTAQAHGELIIGHSYTLFAGRAGDGERAFWIEDARSGEVFVDTR